MITAINGTEVKTGDVLRNTIAMIRPGTTVDLEVARRDGGKTVIKAKLGELPSGPTVAEERKLKQRSGSSGSSGSGSSSSSSSKIETAE